VALVGMVRAHPRSRGADDRSRRDTGRHEGSSPLARGGPSGHGLGADGCGLIPARAGRTAAPHRPRGRQGAHPRSRGADMVPDVMVPEVRGSSPLARGGRRLEVPPGPDLGLIPARAGRTTAPHQRQRPAGAHPRSRGADTDDMREFTRSLGSSPLARGGLCALHERGIRLGLIPARAGRTSSPRQQRRRSGAHPRSRGADLGTTETGQTWTGSSPLARGGPKCRVRRLGRSGLIPARAGRTSSSGAISRHSRAHPRSRGADFRTMPCIARNVGSSPLARGGRPDEPQRSPQRGLIPARAGRTPFTDSLAERRRAHPRSRGADCEDLNGEFRETGSSPLARGGRGILRPPEAGDGRIPARAGRTWLGRECRIPLRAHPRSRGADPLAHRLGYADRGSSPLARGGRRGSSGSGRR